MSPRRQQAGSNTSREGMEGIQERAVRAPKHPLAPSEGARNIRPSQAGTKRLFSDRVSRLLDPSDDDAENDEPVALPPDEIHDEKRSRGSDWPLRKSSLVPVKPELPHIEPESASKKRNLSPVRGSRFLEGSMNDRASKVPPAEFIGERLREEEARNRARARASQQTTSTVSTTDKADAARGSGIFRFGKSVAATFNPANWKIWKGHPQQLDETVHQKALRERQEKAEKIYRELKERGKFRDSAHPPTFHVSDYDVSTARQAARRSKHEDATKHDSGIEFGRTHAANDESTSKEEKRRGRVFLQPPTLQDHDDILPSNQYAISKGPSRSSVSLQATRPISASYVGLQSPDANPSPRTLRSRSRDEKHPGRRSLSVPPMRKGSGGSTTSVAAGAEVEGPSPRVSESDYFSGGSSNGGNNNNKISPRRLRSREHTDVRREKQKQKRTQRKLVKRVSDLEIKLAAARQELQSAAAAGGDDAGEDESGESQATESESQSQESGSGNGGENPKRLSKQPKQKKSIKQQSSSAANRHHIKGQKPLPAPVHPRRRVPSPTSASNIEPADPSSRVTRPRFVPGALATLPSERLLSSYLPPSSPGKNESASPEVRPNHADPTKKPTKNKTKGPKATKEEDGSEEIDAEQIGRALSTDYGERREGFEWPDYVF